MKQTTFDISFYCRESKANREGLAPVEMSIIINGERCIITLPRKEKLGEFKRNLHSKRDNDTKAMKNLWNTVPPKENDGGDNGASWDDVM